MSFFSDKIGIGQDVTIELTSEEVLDSSGDLDLFGSDDGQFGPIACKLIRDPE